MTAIERVAHLALNGKSDREIADETGWPLESVKNLRRKAGIYRRSGRAHREIRD